MRIEGKTKEEIAERYIGLKDGTGVIPDSRLEWLKAGKCPYDKLYDRETKTCIQGYYGDPLDIPRIELRFRKLGPGGEREPCPVDELAIRVVRNGKRHQTGEMEIGQWMFEGSRGYDTVWTVRLLLSETPNSGEFRSLVFGRTYYVKMYRPGYRGIRRTPHLLGTAVITVPEQVPRGEMVVFVLDPTRKHPDFPNRFPSKRHTVTVRVRDELPDVPLLAAITDPGSGHVVRANTLPESGRLRMTVRKLGGELSVIAGREPRTRVLYYKRKVTAENVVFPRDADTVGKPGQAVFFRLKVPADRIASECTGIGLLMRRGSRLPVSGIDFADIDGWDRHTAETLPRAVSVTAVPGTYFVQSNGDDHRRVIGTVTVEEEDQGQTLTVDPL